MTDIKDCFSNNVTDARAGFLAACDAAHIPVTAYSGTATGTEDDRRTVYADVARFGSPSAEKVLVLVPAEGGLSAFLAAGLITATVREKLYRHLDRDVALVLLHAINPKGPLWPAADPESPRPDDWEDHMLAQAEARFQAHTPPARPFNRQSLSNRRLSDMIRPAWDREMIASLAGDFLEECKSLYLLELAEMPGQAGKLALTGADEGHWLPQQPKPPAVGETPVSPLGHHLRACAGLVQSFAATARFGTTPNIPGKAGDKNKERFIPDARPHWEKPVWDSGADLITGTIKTIGALD